MFDVLIIGSGIVGSFIAHTLSKYALKLVLIEKDLEICNGVSKANSAIIHSGYDPAPGTLKAQLNVIGNRMYDDITKKLNVPVKQIGSYTLAFNEEEEEIIKALVKQSLQNKVETRLVSKEEILKSEPNVNSTVRCGLYAPTTKIISPWEMCYALLNNAIENGLNLKRGEEVISIERKNDVFYVQTDKALYQTRYVINAAGLFAKYITEMVSPVSYEMEYTKGEYYVLDQGYDFVKHVIYPCPSKKGKGVLAVPTIEGNILLGPTSERVNERTSNDVTKEGLAYIKNHLGNMFHDIPYQGIIRSFSGIRPKTNVHDFIIEELKTVPHFIQIAGIESPGLASSPAIAKKVLEMILEKEKLILKQDYKIIPLEKHAKYPKGKIVCRCEQVTDVEIIDAIRGPLGARTLDGVKRRVRPGAGRCQGGFCQAEVIRLLSEELKIHPTEVCLNGCGSTILVEETKKRGVEDHE